MFLYISSLHPGWEPSRKMKNKSLPYPDSWHQEKIKTFKKQLPSRSFSSFKWKYFLHLPGPAKMAGTGHRTWSADWLLSKWLSINQTNTRMLTNQGPHTTQHSVSNISTRAWNEGYPKVRGLISIVSYSRPSLKIIVSASQFHVYLPWNQCPFSIVS